MVSKEMILVVVVPSLKATCWSPSLGTFLKRSKSELVHQHLPELPHCLLIHLVAEAAADLTRHVQNMRALMGAVATGSAAVVFASTVADAFACTGPCPTVAAVGGVAGAVVGNAAAGAAAGAAAAAAAAVAAFASAAVE